MKLTLGTNLGFAINRYIEPEVWAKIVSEDLGLRSVQFVADLLNPFLPEEYLQTMEKRVVAAVKEHGISIDSMFTSVYTRVNHLMHPDEAARKIWVKWFQRFLEMGSKFGAKTLGSHFGIMTLDSFDHNYDFILEQGVKN